MEALAGHLARRVAPEGDIAGQPLVRRLSVTVEKLNQLNYHAHWEAGAEGPRVIFAHCPYAAIVEKHPELCAMDRALLRECLGHSVTQIFKTGKEGSSVCVFVVGR
jgi:predicted ArsR family transcriptional regulator